LFPYLGNAGLVLDLLEDRSDDEKDEAGGEQPEGDGQGGLAGREDKAATQQRGDGEDEHGKDAASTRGDSFLIGE
jgi:hypothetical protein